MREICILSAPNILTANAVWAKPRPSPLEQVGLSLPHLCRSGPWYGWTEYARGHGYGWATWTREAIPRGGISLLFSMTPDERIFYLIVSTVTGAFRKGDPSLWTRTLYTHVYMKKDFYFYKARISVSWTREPYYDPHKFKWITYKVSRVNIRGKVAGKAGNGSSCLRMVSRLPLQTKPDQCQ